MTTVIWALVVLVSIALVASVLLYVVSQRVKVEEDPRIDEVEAALPGANCGACGNPGCRGFAVGFVNTKDPSTFYCPVGGNTVMEKIAAIMGRQVTMKEPTVAVVRCAGSPEYRAMVSKWDGASSCRVSAALFEGPTGCSYGCLGMGDCESVCEFDALHMNAETHLPEIDEAKCTSCGKCVKICPKHIIELRSRGPKGRRVFVSCVNQDKGGVAMKNCKVACIGCSKCQKACPFEAITIANNLSYIDFTKCKTCRKCVPVCPTKAIWDVNFPTPVKVEDSPKAEKPSAVSAEA